MLKTAGGYLLVLSTFDELDASSEQCVRLLEMAKAAADWDLCKELARFLMALDESGGTLWHAMQRVNLPIASNHSQTSSINIRSNIDVSKAMTGASMSSELPIHRSFPHLPMNGGLNIKGSEDLEDSRASEGPMDSRRCVSPARSEILENFQSSPGDVEDDRDYFHQRRHGSLV